MSYTVGQVVELYGHGFELPPPLLNGDRGTVVGHEDVFHPIVLWHKDGVRSPTSELLLRIFTYPAEPPGRAKGAYETMEALRTVLQEAQPPAMAEVLLEVERSRMAAEDWRGKMVSPYGTRHHTRDPRFRHLSWREFGEERNEMCDHLVFEVIEPARTELRDVQNMIVPNNYEERWS